MGIRPQGRILLLVLAAGLLALTAAACGGSSDSSDTTASTGGGASLSGEIAGAGSSAQQAAQEAWIAGFQSANPDVSIAYDPVGSGGGREQFVAGGTAYGGSDSALADEELTGAQQRCGGENNLVEVPAYVSPIAVIYNLPDVTSLKLDPETLANIFAQKITKWNDPAIVATNQDVTLPDTNITPVNRSDESGTTENFTDYLSQAAPSVWTFEVSGDWPVKGGEAAEGTSGVVDAVKNGEGTIGYADASQAGDLGVAEIQVGTEFVAPTAGGRGKDLRRVGPERRPRRERLHLQAEPHARRDRHLSNRARLVPLGLHAVRRREDGGDREGLLQLRDQRGRPADGGPGGRFGAAQRCHAREDPTGRGCDRRLVGRRRVDGSKRKHGQGHPPFPGG